MKPTFTIVTCTYNRANLISRAIKSAINQTYKQFELIIIDDGSTDSTGKIVNSIKDSRVRYYRYKNNRGVMFAKNQGVRLARGKYILFLDSDDELYPNALKIALNKFRSVSRDVKILVFDCVDAESNKKSGLDFKKGLLNFEDLLCGKIRGDYRRVIDTSIIKNERFDEDLRSGEILLWLTLHKKYKAMHFPIVIYNAYRHHWGRLSDFEIQLSYLPSLILLNKCILSKHGETLKKLCPEKYGSRLFTLGFWQILNNEKKNGRKNLINSCRYKNFLIPLVVLLLSIFFSPKQISKIFTLFYKCHILG